MNSRHDPSNNGTGWHLVEERIRANERAKVLSEVEKLQEVWEKTFIDSKKEGNNGDIWRGGVLALGELQAKLNQLKEEG